TNNNQINTVTAHLGRVKVRVRDADSSLADGVDRIERTLRLLITSVADTKIDPCASFRSILLEASDSEMTAKQNNSHQQRDYSQQPGEIAESISNRDSKANQDTTLKGESLE